MGNGEWGMENGEWRMENEEWGMGNGEWRTRNGEWRMGNGRRPLPGASIPIVPLGQPCPVSFYFRTKICGGAL